MDIHDRNDMLVDTLRLGAEGRQGSGTQLRTGEVALRPVKGHAWCERMQTRISIHLAPDPVAAEAWRATRRALWAAPPIERARTLASWADESRSAVLATISRAGIGHAGGDLSVLDILTSLYVAVAEVDPLQPGGAERDRIVLSKGHAAVGHYVTLARCGFFDLRALESFARFGSPLGGHADLRRVPGVEASTGPLGHGLPIATGAAIAASIAGAAWRVFVVLGDGELQEGSNWEAAMLAGHRRLCSLTAIIDRNGLQQGGATESTNALEPLAEKWRSFGWDVVELDGHDHLALLEALSDSHTASCGSSVPPARERDRPLCVIARTCKGKGVSFMEGRPQWHHRVPTAGELELALAELAARAEDLRA